MKIFLKHHVDFLLLQKGHAAGDVQRRDALAVPCGDGGDGAALLTDGETLVGAVLGGEIAGHCRAAAAAATLPHGGVGGLDVHQRIDGGARLVQ